MTKDSRLLAILQPVVRNSPPYLARAADRILASSGPELVRSIILDFAIMASAHVAFVAGSLVNVKFTVTSAADGTCLSQSAWNDPVKFIRGLRGKLEGMGEVGRELCALVDHMKVLADLRAPGVHGGNPEHNTRGRLHEALEPLCKWIAEKPIYVCNSETRRDVDTSLVSLDRYAGIGDPRPVSRVVPRGEVPMARCCFTLLASAHTVWLVNLHPLVSMCHGGEPGEDSAAGGPGKPSVAVYGLTTRGRWGYKTGPDGYTELSDVRPNPDSPVGPVKVSAAWIENKGRVDPAVSKALQQHGFSSLEYIGEGSFGVVYKAKHDGATVAVKVMHEAVVASEEEARRLRREILRMTGSTKVKGVVSYLGFDGAWNLGDKTHYPVWFCMEFLDGRIMSDWTQDPGASSQEERERVGLEIVRTTARLHRLGVVHRDIRPDNIMMMPHDLGIHEPILLDLGLAHFPVGLMTTGSSTLFPAGFRGMGRPPYAPDEQLDVRRQEDARDPRVDVHALGRTISELLGLVSKDQPGPPSLTAPGQHRWAGILVRCMEQKPENRPRDAEELLQELERAQDIEADAFGPGCSLSDGTVAESWAIEGRNDVLEVVVDPDSIASLRWTLKLPAEDAQATREVGPELARLGLQMCRVESCHYDFDTALLGISPPAVRVQPLAFWTPPSSATIRSTMELLAGVLDSARVLCHCHRSALLDPNDVLVTDSGQLMVMALSGRRAGACPEKWRTLEERLRKGLLADRGTLSEECPALQSSDSSEVRGYRETREATALLGRGFALLRDVLQAFSGNKLEWREQDTALAAELHSCAHPVSMAWPAETTDLHSRLESQRQTRLKRRNASREQQWVRECERLRADDAAEEVRQRAAHDERGRLRRQEWDAEGRREEPPEEETFTFEPSARPQFQKEVFEPRGRELAPVSSVVWTAMELPPPCSPEDHGRVALAWDSPSDLLRTALARCTAGQSSRRYLLCLAQSALWFLASAMGGGSKNRMDPPREIAEVPRWRPREQLVAMLKSQVDRCCLCEPPALAALVEHAEEAFRTLDRFARPLPGKRENDANDALRLLCHKILETGVNAEPTPRGTSKRGLARRREEWRIPLRGGYKYLKDSPWFRTGPRGLYWVQELYRESPEGSDKTVWVVEYRQVPGCDRLPRTKLEGVPTDRGNQKGGDDRHRGNDGIE